MIKRTFNQIREMAKGLNQTTQFGDVMVEGVTIDSRKIEPNNLFVPLVGEHVNGHQFVEKAFLQGAAASFWQSDMPNPPEGLPLIIVDDVQAALQQLAKAYRHQVDCKVVGITGSNGKTTTKDMTAALLSKKYKVCKTRGNYNNHLGMPLTLLSMDEDTDVAVLEMGMSSRGEIEFLSALAQPDIAVITNIGESHLLDLGSREEIANAKLEIVAGMADGGTLIYQGDEPLLLERIDGKYPHLKTVSFGRGQDSALYAASIMQNQDTTSFKLEENGDEYMIPVLGNHNVLNALAAILTARELQVSETAIKEGLKTIQLTNMRMEMVAGANGEKIINDAYNASPTSVKAAIELVEGMTGFKHKHLVFGDMLELGPQEESFHLKIGEMINPNEINYLYTFGPLAQKIAEGAGKQFSSENVHSFQDKSALILKLKELSKAGDLILVKASRGMKLEEVVSALQAKSSVQ